MKPLVHILSNVTRAKIMMDNSKNFFEVIPNRQMPIRDNAQFITVVNNVPQLFKKVGPRITALIIDYTERN